MWHIPINGLLLCVNSKIILDKQWKKIQSVAAFLKVWRDLIYTVLSDTNPWILKSRNHLWIVNKHDPMRWAF